MIKKITEEELNFIELWHTPRCLVESLFSNFDNLAEFLEDKFGTLRLYQLPMVSDEPLIDFETTAKYNKLNRKQKEKLRQNVGNIYDFSARKIGKTLCHEKLDIPISMLHDANKWCGFCSIDSIHLEVLNIVKDGMESHPILKNWKGKQWKGAPNYCLTGKNGWKLDGINMNLNSRSPGNYFYGKHVNKLWGEEMSFETEEIAKKRGEALSEYGAVLRLSGMTNFTKHSPIGKLFYSPTNKKYILNLPQYVSPLWDEEEKKSRIEKYGGEDAPSYLIYVEGEVIEDGVSEFDIERVQKCYNEKKELKRFEINKENFKTFRNRIIVERPSNAERIFIAGDVGDGQGGSELIVLSEIGETYNYLYNITLISLKQDEQLDILKYIIDNLKANVIAVDCGDALGRAVADNLEKTYTKENVVRYAGNLKVNVEIELDDSGNVKMKNGKPVYREEFMSEWSVRRLKVLLYENKINMPMDYKFDNQINSVISMTSGTRRIYRCIAETGDHLFDAFKVFAISQWLKKDFNDTKPMNSTDWGIGVS